MKKITYAFVCAAMCMAGLTGQAADLATGSVKLFSITVDRSAVDSKIQIDLGALDGQQVQVDWGDGTYTDGVAVARYQTYAGTTENPDATAATSFSGVVAGTTITFYGSNAANICFVGAEYTLADEALIKAIDVTALTGLKELLLSRNNLTGLDISNNTVLAKLDAANNQLQNSKFVLPQSTTLTSVDVSNNLNIATGELNEEAGNNQVLGAAWKNLPNLATLNVTANNVLGGSFWSPETFDISSNTKLTTLTVNGCALKKLDLSVQTMLKTLNCQRNELTTLDCSSMVAAGGVVMAAYNQLTSITLPEIPANATSTQKMLRVNIGYNNLTLATLPLPGMTKSAANYVYANQGKVRASLNAQNVVDLASMANVNGVASTFTWNSAAGAVAADYYSVADGVFTFNKDITGLYCQIKNSTFPSLTLETYPSTSVGAMPVMFTIDAEADEAKKLTFKLASNNPAGQDLFIDWGDGKFEGPFSIIYETYQYSPTTTFAGTPKGTQIVVKGDPTTIESLNCNGAYDFKTKVPTTVFASGFDLTKLTTLKNLNLAYNDVSKIDLTSNTDLRTLNLSNNSLRTFSAELAELITLDLSNYCYQNKYYYGNNTLKSVDFSKYPKLESLTISGNVGMTVDFAKIPAVKTMYAIGCEMTKIAPASNVMTTLSLNGNSLTEVDLTGLTQKCNVFLLANKLNKITVPQTLGNLNVANNNLTFATLPAQSAISGTLTFKPQNAMPLPVKWNNSIDLSAQAKVGETATAFVWKKGTETIPAADYTEADGVFTFKSNFEGITCAMTNAEYSGLELTTVAVTSPSTTYGKMLTLGVASTELPLTVKLGQETGADMPVYVDWGNGDVQGPIQIASKSTGSYDDVNVLKSNPAGATVTVYGQGENIHTVNCRGAYVWATGAANSSFVTSADLSALVNLKELNFDSNGLSTLDLTNNKKLTKLSAQGNSFTGFDADLPALTSLDLSNIGSAFKWKWGQNDVKSVNLEKLPSLVSLTLNYNSKTADEKVYDLSKAKSLEIFSAIASNLTSVTLPEAKTLYNLNVRNNQLKSLDCSNMVLYEGLFSDVLSVMALYNQLESIKTPAKMTTLNIQNNKFNFATLPLASVVDGTYEYANQEAMTVTPKGNDIDLSSQAMVGDTETVFEWKSNDAVVDASKYVAKSGIFTFKASVPQLVCVMTNAALPKLTLSTQPIDMTVSGIVEVDSTGAEVEYFNLQGVKVKGDQPGVYIRRQGSKTEKVVIR